MSIFEGLVFLLSVGTVPVLCETSGWLASRWYRRAPAALALAGLGLNVQFTAHPWQAWLLLALAVAASAVAVRGWRWALLLVTAFGGPFLLDPGIAATAGHRFFGPQRMQILLVVSGFVFAVLAGSVLVEQVLRRIKGLPGSSEEAGAEPGPLDLGTGAPAGGRVIGMPERAFALRWGPGRTPGDGRPGRRRQVRRPIPRVQGEERAEVRRVLPDRDPAQPAVRPRRRLSHQRSARQPSDALSLARTSLAEPIANASSGGS